MSQISPPVFSSEKELFSWTYLLKKTPRRTKILISSILEKIFKNPRLTFWAHTNRSTMQQKLFQFFLTTKCRSLWKKHIKGTAKPTPKIEKIWVLCIYREHLICLQSNASGISLQTCINFVERRLKFSHFEGSIL